MDKEIWKDIEGYEDLYQVSNFGRVKSLVDRLGKKRELILKANTNKQKYLFVTLYKGKNIKTLKIHRLVAEAFISNPEHKPTVNHLDGNKQNNNLNNLEWATRSEQTKHAFKIGLMKVSYGEKASNAKLTDEQAIKIRAEYVPYSRKYGTYALAKKYGVKPDAIQRIVKEKTFKHLQINK